MRSNANSYIDVSAAGGSLPHNLRRSVYFAFQGLLMAILMLIFFYQHELQEGWPGRFAALFSFTILSLGALGAVPLAALGNWWFQAGLFIADAVFAALVLHWTGSQSDLFLIYMLIIYGTALTRSFKQSFIVALVTAALYLFSAWTPAGLPSDSGFWLRFQFLITSTVLMAILSLDVKQVQADQEKKFHERAVQVERLAVLGRMAAEVAHRIKGPLTTIMVNAEVLSHTQKSKEVLKELEEIRHEAGHCKQILKNLLDLGRIEEMDFQPTDLREPIRLALKSVEAQFRQKAVRKQVSGLDEPLMVLGDQSLLQEAVAAVLQNAVDALGKSGHIRLSVTRAPARSKWLGPAARKPAYQVIIEDNGQGIAEDQLENIFQPFFTTKGKEGSGLGLSAALRIMQKHNGSIEADSEGRGRGAVFTLLIPAAS
ncbi:MAG: hypothetical protein A3J74_06795 [Elusimicrobia bacterium RIFCSPHIGHO2_02_FULL_57_9]|nr:MAG: hypothetical protein A3J74_06795 [Elusimicrobia bacterium RIFCSPHIGHO2_02_FULL_57_9]